VGGVSAHQPIRPGWTCTGCGAAWPCGTRRRQLAAESTGARVSRMLFLAACFVDACSDMPHETVGALYSRSLLWPQSAGTHTE
jgi:hypothetical protein